MEKKNNEDIKERMNADPNFVPQGRYYYEVCNLFLCFDCSIFFLQMEKKRKNFTRSLLIDRGLSW